MKRNHTTYKKKYKYVQENIVVIQEEWVYDTTLTEIATFLLEKIKQ